jgi:phosphatidylglycerol:prolipoprotein diacylglycerol transferase
MSFHGGFLGVLAGIAIFCQVRKKRWITTMDFLAPLTPIGLGAGRIGNFINGELPGRPTDLPWGMWFPQVDRALARHPRSSTSSRSKAWRCSSCCGGSREAPVPRGGFGAFLVGYGSFRFLAEFARQPTISWPPAFGLSMGQWLSLPMISRPRHDGGRTGKLVSETH